MSRKNERTLVASITGEDGMHGRRRLRQDVHAVLGLTGPCSMIGDEGVVWAGGADEEMRLSS